MLAEYKVRFHLPAHTAKTKQLIKYHQKDVTVILSFQSPIFVSLPEMTYSLNTILNI